LTVGAVVPREGGGLVAAVPGGFRVLNDGVPGEWLATLEGDRPDNRMNDGKCAPDGSFWAGTMARDATAGAGSLYRLDPKGELTTILGGLSVSNGLGWVNDGQLYFIDTATQGVDVLRAGPEGWTRDEFVRIPRDFGVPDGLCVDGDGNAWVAMCFGGRVLCYSPAGEHIATVEVPAELTTSVCFGGPDLDRLYITTGRTGLTAEQLAAQPHAGSVFVCEPGVPGMPTYAYAG
jgi:sugar lactone lactonase YvrE